MFKKITENICKQKKYVYWIITGFCFLIIGLIILILVFIATSLSNNNYVVHLRYVSGICCLVGAGALFYGIKQRRNFMLINHQMVPNEPISPRPINPYEVEAPYDICNGIQQPPYQPPPYREHAEGVTPNTYNAGVEVVTHLQASVEVHTEQVTDANLQPNTIPNSNIPAIMPPPYSVNDQTNT